MNGLLDTCTFLWLVGEPHRLSASARQICTAPGTSLFLSAVSVWEIEVKYRLGRLHLAEAPARFVPAQRIQHGIYPLAFDEASALRQSTLPLLHKDPFDRMLICQALEHQMILLTPDAHITRYAVPVAW